MIANKTKESKMCSAFFLKPGQTIKNTKASDRTLTLLCPKSTYQHFLDYTTEKERLKAEKHKEIQKLEELKKATHDMTKTWDNTIRNSNLRRNRDFLLKKQEAELQREQFVKESKEKSAAERAEIINQARRLLLYKKPLCRRINSALLASECYRELESQLAFQKTLKEMDEIEEKKYVDKISEKVREDKEKEEKEIEERLNKQKNYNTEIRQQIDDNRNNEISLRQREIAVEKEDQKNMTEEIEKIKQCETEINQKKKQNLRQMFEEAIEQRKNREREEKCAEELENQTLEAYCKAKNKIIKMNKEAEQQKKAEKQQWMQITVEAAEKQLHPRRIDEEVIFQNAVKEKEAAEEEKRKAREAYEKSLKADRIKFWNEFQEVQAKKEQEKKEFKYWQMMQRFKRDEYNKQVEFENRKRDWENKMEYAKQLQKLREEQEAERKRKELEDEKVDDVKEAIEKATQMVLDYGNEVLEESKGVRPLYPIVKAIQESKKDLGLPVTKGVEEVPEIEKPKRKRGIRRTCTKTVPEEKAFYFN